MRGGDTEHEGGCCLPWLGGGVEVATHKTRVGDSPSIPFPAPQGSRERGVRDTGPRGETLGTRGRVLPTLASSERDCERRPDRSFASFGNACAAPAPGASRLLLRVQGSGFRLLWRGRRGASCQHWGPRACSGASNLLNPPTP